MPHVLLTNDDGVSEEGLRAWREELLSLGMRVSVVAPAVNQSGKARAVSCHEPTEVNLVSSAGGNPVFSCTGTPVDCVRVGMLSGLLEPVDVVASGINHGVNLGDDATYSGTLGAALEGALLGKPGLAVSQQDDAGDYSLLSRGEHHFAMAWFAAALVGLLAEDPPADRLALNVNIPHRVADRAVEITRPASFRYPPMWTPPDRLDDDSWRVWPYARPGQPDPNFDISPGTDIAALANGAISISAIASDWNLSPQSVRDWRDWIERMSQGAVAAVSSR